MEFRSDLDISVWNPGEDVSTYKRVLPGDFVIGLRSFQSGIGLSPLSGLVSPAYTVLRATGDLHSDFFKHFFKSDAFISQLNNVAQGIRQGRTIATQDFYDLALPLPPLPVQRAIANYLDTETARLDALIAKKRDLITAAEERHRTLVVEMMSNHASVRLKRLVRYIEGPGIMADDFRDNGVALIRVSGVGGREVSLDGCNYLDPGKVAARWRHFALRVGDRLISASASMGIVSIVGAEAAGAIPYTGLIAFRPRTADVDMDYIELFLGSQLFVEQINVLKTGTAIQHFGPTHLGEVVIPLPEPQRQGELARSLRASQRHLDALKHALNNQIALLAEHRRALITAAVMGELEVPAVAA